MDFIVTKKNGGDAVHAYIQDYPTDETLQVTVKPYKRNRSREQNALLHAWFNDISRQYHDTHGELFSSAVWKEYFKSILLGIESFDSPRGTLTRTRRTRDLKVGEMTAFMEQIQNHCAEEFNIILKSPDEL